MEHAADVDNTSNRIVAAAAAEFALRGLSGARIDQIARAARTSKERVYAHFRSKEALYRHVVGRELAAMAEAVELEPADLPDYAGRLFDHARKHPDRHRLMLWEQLEASAGEATTDDPVLVTLQDKLTKLRAGQRAGVLDPEWAPEDVLVFVTQLATSWATSNQLFAAEDIGDAFLADRRAAVVAAVARLFPAHEESLRP